ncbi:MAG: hypothetical protein PHU34_09085 [Candidatus Methanoperedens sp.]|nr:hypothetical protein [Candidatus Methanoperedens sp.]
MEIQTKENQTMYTGAMVAIAIFIAVAYYLPTEKFFAVFAAGLFLIPAMIFIYLVQKVAR